jgi:hypothetical protein
LASKTNNGFFATKRRVLNGSPGMSDWLLVTRRHKSEKIQKVEIANANANARRFNKLENGKIEQKLILS